MNGERWRLARERVEADGRRVLLFACEFSREGQARRWRRVTERSRAGVDPKDRRGPAWCVVEYCERAPDGTLSPWRQEWEHRRESETGPQSATLQGYDR